MNDNNEYFNKVDTMKYWVQKILPQCYDDSLSYQEILYKVVHKLNELCENVNNIPDYVQKMILEYISGGAISDVIHDILSNFMLNVKNPPNNLTPAVGDGSEDDTSAIQGCIDYANANGGKCVYFPSGVYLTQSLTLKDNVSLAGFDRSNTRLVLRGGATKALINGNVNNCTISKLALDGNMDIQVNNIDLVDITSASDLVLNELSLTDGFNLLKIVANGDVTANEILFKKAVVDALVVSGTGTVIFDNIVVKELSTLNGRYAVNNTVDNAVFTNINSRATTDVAIKNTGNKCVFIGQVLNAVKIIEDTGVDTYTNFYANGGSSQSNIEAEATARANGDKANADAITAEGNARSNADTALQEHIDAEATARTNADTALSESISAETTNRTNANTALQGNIDAEATARTNADTALSEAINAEMTARQNADDAQSLAITNIQNQIGDIGSHQIINIKNLGAKGDGVTDDTAIFVNAFNDTTIKAIYIPAGYYLLKGTGATILTLTRSIKLYGDGMFRSCFLLDAGVPSTTNLLTIKGQIQGMQIFDLGFVRSGDGSVVTVGNHMIYIDLTTAGDTFNSSSIERCYFDPTAGNSIKMMNEVNTDGFFTTAIRDCTIYGGIDLVKSGDSISIVHNKIGHKKMGINLTTVSGAMRTFISENNITSNDGAINILDSSEVTIANNQIEMLATSTASSLIVINGGNNHIITGNNLDNNGFCNNDVVLANTYKVIIDNNSMHTALVHIYVGTGCVDTYIGNKNVARLSGSIVTGLRVSNNGDGTTGVSYPLTLLNSWAEYDSANHYAPYVRKSPDGVVTLGGQVTGGTVTPYTKICTLPVKFRPKGVKLFQFTALMVRHMIQDLH
jgi:hypothetical protein